jgi:PAS domain S-box-containing protein
LQENLREAQETLDAIRSGEVDAVVVSGPRGSQVYSLTGAEQPYRVYVEHMQEGAATISSGGLILYANQRFAEMVNQPLDRVIGSVASAYLGGPSWTTIHGMFENHKEVVKCESVLQLSGGRLIPVNLTASHLPMAGQNVLCLVVTDLTAQKQNEELRLAKEVAEKANLNKDAFLAALSHELRTPLSPVLLLATEASQNKSLPPKVRADFATICKNVELEARLIDDLLDITRITTGKLALEFSPVDIHAVLRSAIEMVKSQIEQKNIRLSLNLEEKASAMEADSIRMQQVFWNILKNAVKFTPENGKITVRTDLESGRLLVSISDTGIGMTRDELERAFDSFAQGDHATNGGARRFGGLGLGLAITRKLVESHGGWIKAASRGRDQGATFKVNLPLTDLPIARTAQKKTEADAARDAGPEMPGRMRILLVEDHEPTRVALSRLLTRRHHSVEGASSVAEARQLATKDKFDLVISDIGLPDGTGYELMTSLRGEHRLRGVALTGFGTEQDIAESRRAGFFTHLTKPIRADQLEAVLAMVRKDDFPKSPA